MTSAAPHVLKSSDVPGALLKLHRLDRDGLAGRETRQCAGRAQAGRWNHHLDVRTIEKCIAQPCKQSSTVG